MVHDVKYLTELPRTAKRSRRLLGFSTVDLQTFICNGAVISVIQTQRAWVGVCVWVCVCVCVRAFIVAGAS